MQSAQIPCRAGSGRCGVRRPRQRNLRAPAAIEFLVQPDLHSCRELRQSRVYLGLDLCSTSSTARHAVPLSQPVEHHRECSLPAHSRGKHPDRDSRVSGFCRNSSRSVVKWPRRRGPGGGGGSRAPCGGRSTRPSGRRARGSCTRRCRPSPQGRRVQRRRERLGGGAELLGDDRGILLVVPAVDDPFLPPHGDEPRILLGPHQQEPLPLHLEHVADVARVLQRGPHVGRGSRPHPTLGNALEGAPQRRGVCPERRGDLGPGQRVVVVPALVAVHGSNLRPPMVPPSCVRFDQDSRHVQDRCLVPADGR